MNSNPIVQFLRSYGPIPASDSLYDEHVQSAARKYGVREINIPTDLVGEVGSLLTGDDPKNVILTGTAGDGKTYHIRRIFQEHLGGKAMDWPGDDLVIEVKLPNGTVLRIIRDLSELPSATKDEEIGRVTASLLGECDGIYYLIAANDGQLLELWRRAEMSGANTSGAHAKVRQRLSTMLRQEDSEDQSGLLSLKMYNLSRRSRRETIDQVIDALLQHTAWESGCGSCPLAHNGAETCPIQINRKLLLGTAPDPASQTFRARLQALLEVAAANDDHLPLRQLFILVVNIILGDSKHADAPLLNCEEARERAALREYVHTNPYDNAVGKNLAEHARAQYTVFSTLDKFALGFETTNQFDALLLRETPLDLVEKLEDVDPTYGRALFSPHRKEYVRDPRSRATSELRGFLTALNTQRRRLFFQLPESSNQHLDSVWFLTVFHNGGRYLDFKKLLATSKPDSGAVDKVERNIVQGFNRALTGMMTDDTERLWLAHTVGRSDDPTGRLVTEEPIPRRKSNAMFHLLFLHDQTLGRPQVTVGSPYPAISMDANIKLDLTPLLFEYLCRIAAGSLPSSFSRQCQQEVKYFARIVRQQIATLLQSQDIDLNQIRVLSLNDDASIKAKDIKVIVA